MDASRSLLDQTHETVTTIIAKATPPAAVVGAQIMGLAVDDWIKWITLIYVILMLLHKLWILGLGMYQFWVLKLRDAPQHDDE